mmetsp:Transcript_5911/g.7701  ORF Transcript_5911/g.7701 Transcript_5911/m.7701 type:complete len:201 (-) Transcript_5911:311-913(-)
MPPTIAIMHLLTCCVSRFSFSINRWVSESVRVASSPSSSMFSTQSSSLTSSSSPLLVPSISSLAAGGNVLRNRIDNFTNCVSKSWTLSFKSCCWLNAFGVNVNFMLSRSRAATSRSASNVCKTVINSFLAAKRLFLCSSVSFAELESFISSVSPTLCCFSESFLMRCKSRCNSRFRVCDWTHCACNCFHRAFKSPSDLVV